MQAFRKIYRHIFHGMHSDISQILQHTLLQLFNKQAFAANLGQRRIENFIAPRHHFNQLCPHSWQCPFQ